MVNYLIENFAVREIYNERKPCDSRFVIVDPATGKIIDDAGGEGYKTRPKANAAYRYKLKKWKKEKGQ